MSIYAVYRLRGPGNTSPQPATQGKDVRHSMHTLPSSQHSSKPRYLTFTRTSHPSPSFPLPWPWPRPPPSASSSGLHATACNTSWKCVKHRGSVSNSKANTVHVLKGKAGGPHCGDVIGGHEIPHAIVHRLIFLPAQDERTREQSAPTCRQHGVDWVRKQGHGQRSRSALFGHHLQLKITINPCSLSQFANISINGLHAFTAFAFTSSCMAFSSCNTISSGARSKTTFCWVRAVPEMFFFRVEHP